MAETEYTEVAKTRQLDNDMDGSDDTDALTAESGDDTQDLEFYRTNPGEVITEDLG